MGCFPLAALDRFECKEESSYYKEYDACMTSEVKNFREKAKTQRDYFNLWYICTPIPFGVQISQNELGITRQEVETSIRARLRSARIYQSDSSIWKNNEGKTTGGLGYFAIRVGLYENAKAFRVEAHFSKLYEDPTPSKPKSYEGAMNNLTSWKRDVSGTYSSNNSISKNFILSSITPLVDEFIDDYLRVNQAACEKRWSQATDG